MSLQGDDVSLRLIAGQTDRAAEQGDFTHILDAVESGADGALLTLQHYILGGELVQNPGQARKTSEKIARTFFAQPDSKLAGTFASVLSSSLAWTGRMSEQTALEVFVSLLFGMLISDDAVESELGMNLIREGVKKKKEFRRVICGRGGLLGRSALILTPSTSSSLNMITPLHAQLNVIELLIDLAKGKVSIWDTSDSESLLDALQLNIEEEKDNDKDDDENDEDRLNDNIKSLLLLLDSKGLKKKNQISNNERKEFEDRIRIAEERTRIVEEEKRKAEEGERKAEEEKRVAQQLVILLETGKKEAEERARIAEEKATRLQIEKETQFQNLIHQPGWSVITLNQWTELAKEMKKPFGKDEQENKQIEERVEEICELIRDTFKDKEDERGRKNSIQGGIAEAFIFIFTQWPLDKIMKVHSKAFLYLTYPSNIQIKLLLFEKKPFASLLRLLDHTNRYVVDDAIASIINIILGGTNITEISEPHPHYTAMDELGGFDKIFELFNRNLSKYTRDSSAICIGRFFRAQEIPDLVMRQEIIQHLKTLANGQEGIEKNVAKYTLKGLSQNAVNRVEIEKDGFVVPL
ncbi:MAG: hypothetical protein EZS28_013074 [Streblomastix strix]|uniref:Uncharacterized protein n=1 Tax=Streblomastix strix TaxID=222440 RepID=A0A5J4W962_9EUKA|nr:MAG: hypothetical protein EZS28_013074 [Streblomastix strix]